jgi:hypothetical protein
MISVFVQCHNQEAELARTLSALISGAVEGLISDVTILDLGSSDGSSIVADAAGCNFCSLAQLDHAVQKMRGEWALLIEPGARPAIGWIDVLGEHIATSDASARFCASKTYKLPIMTRIFGPKTRLQHGVIIPKHKFLERAVSAPDLEQLVKGLRTIRLECEMVPAAYLKVAV